MIFRQKVNPGSTVNDVPLLFDVPAGTSIADVELHGSLSSAGVKVTLPRPGHQRASNVSIASIRLRTWRRRILPICERGRSSMTTTRRGTL